MSICPDQDFSAYDEIPQIESYWLILLYMAYKIMLMASIQNRAPKSLKLLYLRNLKFSRTKIWNRAKGKMGKVCCVTIIEGRITIEIRLEIWCEWIYGLGIRDRVSGYWTGIVGSIGVWRFCMWNWGFGIEIADGVNHIDSDQFGVKVYYFLNSFEGNSLLHPPVHPLLF